MPWPRVEPLAAALHTTTLQAPRACCAPPLNAHTLFLGWDTQHVHDTAIVLKLDDGTSALGAAVASREHINAEASETVLAAGELRDANLGLNQALTEVHTWHCADVSNLMYHLNGDVLDHDLLASFVGTFASLCRDLLDHSWWQATKKASSRRQ